MQFYPRGNGFTLFAKFHCTEDSPDYKTHHLNYDMLLILKCILKLKFKHIKMPINEI
jgi:hypothetical protein